MERESMDTVPETVQDILERLLLLCESQSLVERAKRGYAGWYANEAEEMPYKPEEVQMEFWKQTLYFQPGFSVSLNPSITTAFKMMVHHQEFGYYSLFTLLDGTVDDDSIGWGEPLFYELLDDPGPVEPIAPEPLNNFTGVPEHLRDIFPRLSQLAQQQRLLQRAEMSCAIWFRNHPTWSEQYPQSLVELPNPHSKWFQDHPTWFRGYPVVSFPGNCEVRTSFDKQQLCFKDAEARPPYILTTLNVFAGGYEIGEYYLATYLNGAVVEDVSGILPFPFFH